MGRPRKTIDWEIVNEYLEAQCPGTSIAAKLGIHADTLYKACEDKYKMGFSAYSQQKGATGLDILRKKMYDTAIGGNVTMMIWLSKQYLGFSDKTNVDMTLERLSEADLDIIISKMLNEKNKL